MSAPTPDLDAIKARSEAATPAPWTPGDTNPQAVVARNVNKHGQHRVIGNWGTHADAEFVAHARKDIPALLDALAAVTAERDNLQRRLEWQGALTRALAPYQERALDAERERDHARQMLADTWQEGSAAESDAYWTTGPVKTNPYRAEDNA
jgi:hypothetical protein